MGDDAGQEWTVVPKKAKRGKNPAKHKALPVASSSSQDTDESDYPPNKSPPSDAQVKELKDKIQKCQIQWRETACRECLISEVLRRLSDPQDVASDSENKEVTKTFHRIDTALCAGLGSFESDSDHRRSIWQLCLFLDVVDTLQAHYDTCQSSATPNDRTPSIRKLASEPLLTGLDEAVLVSLGFEVNDPITIDGANAVEEVMEGHRVFLFAPFLAWGALLPEIFAIGHFFTKPFMIHRPRLYIGTSLTGIIESLERFAKKLKPDEYAYQGIRYLQTANKVRSPRSGPYFNINETLTANLDWNPIKLHYETQTPDFTRGCYHVAATLVDQTEDGEWQVPEFELHGGALHGLRVSGFRQPTECIVADAHRYSDICNL